MNDPDLVMAYRLLYYCEAISLIPDSVYDKMEKTARRAVDAKHPLNRPGSDNKEDYEPAVRALAIYLRLRYSKRETKVETKPVRSKPAPGANGILRSKAEQILRQVQVQEEQNELF